jgi:hypothetical protein
MMNPPSEKLALAVVTVFAAVIALISARPYAGSWNDGSRLAAVECLVDHGTLAIDDSLFVAVPQDDPVLRSPYCGVCLEHGTLDKLWIQGHYYSDKSPVPAVLLAAVYAVLHLLMGLGVRLHPESFCYAMTVASSGVAYVVAVVCVFRFGRLQRLSLRWRLALCGSFAMASVAVIYVQHVNNHMMLLGVASLLMLQLAQVDKRAPLWRSLLIGTLAGLGYAIDLGAGPVLVVCAVLYLAWQARPRLGACVAFTAGLMPCLVAHHLLNFAVGGTLGPANAVPEYFDWPGCPFHGAQMTGAWHHPNLFHFGLYALDLLFGRRGFFDHNLALFLLVPGAFLLWRQRPAQWPQLLFAAAWAGGTWLLYAAGSKNYSGVNCSIRWLVPLLAPGYYCLTVLLAHQPRLRISFLLLSGWGLVLMALAWNQGPWTAKVPGFWLILPAALTSWGLYSWRILKQIRPAAGLKEEIKVHALRVTLTHPRLRGVLHETPDAARDFAPERSSTGPR